MDDEYDNRRLPFMLSVGDWRDGGVTSKSNWIGWMDECTNLTRFILVEF
jgi:hypothetical protein